MITLLCAPEDALESLQYPSSEGRPAYFIFPPHFTFDPEEAGAICHTQAFYMQEMPNTPFQCKLFSNHR